MKIQEMLLFEKIDDTLLWQIPVERPTQEKEDGGLGEGRLRCRGEMTGGTRLCFGRPVSVTKE